MRILLISDFHGRQAAFDFTLCQANDFDAICIPGDLLDMLPGRNLSLQRQSEGVLQWLRTFPQGRARLFITTGNHDWWPGDDAGDEGRWLQRARRKNVFVDGDITDFEGVTFVCTGWNQPISIPAKGPVILLQHAPPEGTLVSCENQGWDNGDFELRHAIEGAAPDHLRLVLSGHVHHPLVFGEFVRSTLCLNAGCDLSAKVPRHIVVDTSMNRAWFMRDGVLCGTIAL